MYISGDTVYFKGIDEIAKRFKVDIGIFHMGAVQFKYLTGFGRYTMNGKDLLKSATLINPNKIIPIHYRGWSHFTEQQPELKKIIDTDENISRKTIYLQAGIATLL